MYDGGLSTSPMMGKYCGDSIPPSHVSSSNKILFHFQSDYTDTEAGFQMEYQPRGKQNTPIQNNTKYHSQISASNKVLIHFQYDGSATYRISGNSFLLWIVVALKKF